MTGSPQGGIARPLGGSSTMAELRPPGAKGLPMPTPHVPKSSKTPRGAMTQAMRAVQKPPSDAPRVLRLGVIRDRRIEEETTVHAKTSVWAGASERNDVICAGLKDRTELFAARKRGYTLTLCEGMRAKLSDGAGGVREIAGPCEIELSSASRGRVQIQSTVVLFQFVVPPPPAVRPQLPTAARGGLGVDWMFTSFLVASYMTFFGFVIFLENSDWQLEQRLEVDSDIVARLVFTEPEPPPPDAPEPEVVEPDADPVEPERVEVARTETTTRGESNNDSPRDSAAQAEVQARIAEQARQATLVLLGTNAGLDGAFQNLLDTGPALSNASEILEGVTGVGIATTADNQLRTRDGGLDGSGEHGLDRLRRGPPAASVMTGIAPERTITGITTLASGGGDTGGVGEFDSALVVRGIRGRLRRIQNCYERVLTRSPGLREGRVNLEFTITERGSLTGVRAGNNTTGNSAVAACVTDGVRGLRFNPGPVGGSVDFSYPFVFSPQN